MKRVNNLLIKAKARPYMQARLFYSLGKLSGVEPLRIIGARAGLEVRRFLISPDVVNSMVNFALHVTQVI